MMEDLMKILLEGAQTQKKQQPQVREAGILTDILEGALKGGRPAPQRSQQQPDMFNIADLLNVVLGGGKGGGAQAQVNPLLAPIVNVLAQKLGISPAIAQLIVTFATSALLSRGQDNKGGAAIGAGGQQGFDLDDLLEGDFAYSSGLAKQLSQQSGLDEDEAAYGLQEAMMMLSGHPSFKQASGIARPKAQPSPSQLDNLLDTWQVDG